MRCPTICLSCDGEVVILRFFNHLKQLDNQRDELEIHFPYEFVLNSDSSKKCRPQITGEKS